MNDNNALITNLPVVLPACVNGEVCTEVTDSKCAIYSGPVLSNLGISPLDRLEGILGKIDAAIGNVQSPPTPYYVRFVNLTQKHYSFHLQQWTGSNYVDMSGYPADVAPGAAIEIDMTTLSGSFNLQWQFVPTAGESTYTSKSYTFTSSTGFGSAGNLSIETGGDSIGYLIQYNRTIIVTGN